ncbi:MAG: hypothetical protein CMB99_12085 [Flavobacteriaceae bacterium]|nr:hypothetical protein [Flavobacteriaceae bacterium]|tara:strand:+ start:135744 stop:136202 length:459 start_codon:yes stop_codon:yes gene_type:complete
MNSIKGFLGKLDDNELAFFVKFKYHTYMKPTQEKIQDYLEERNFNISGIETLINKNPKEKLNDNKERCPRCFSDKLRKRKVEWTATEEGFGLEDQLAVAKGFENKATYKNEIVCNVCEFWIKDPNHQKPISTSKKILDGIYKIFKGVLTTNN